VVQLASLGNGELIVAEIRVAGRMVGTTISDLAARGGCHPAALVRGGKADLPPAEMVLEEGDLVVVTIPAEEISRVEALLAQEA
jgi:Trk K+ transport system NAD-binding subunit